MTGPEVWTKPPGDPRKIVMTLSVFTSGRLADLYDEPTERVSLRAYRQGPSASSVGGFSVGGVAGEAVLLARAAGAPAGTVPIPSRLRARDRRLLRATSWPGVVAVVGVVLAAVAHGAGQVVGLGLAILGLGVGLGVLFVWALTHVRAVLTVDRGHVVITGLERECVRHFAEQLARGRSGVTGPPDVLRVTSVPIASAD